MSERIAILCSDGPHHRYLVALLSARFQVLAVAVETDAARRRRLRKQRKTKDYLFSVYHHLRRGLSGLDSYRRAYFTVPEELANVPTPQCINVEWINDPQVINLLKRVSPTLTIVMGTSILRSAVLAAAGGTVLNIHGGFLPNYRGNHCFFFAMYNADFERIGSTIHFIDAGIDTGDIVEVVVPELRPNDTPETLYCRAEKMAIDRLIHWIDQIERGASLPRRPQGKEGMVFRTRDRKPHHDVYFFLRRKFFGFPNARVGWKSRARRLD